MYIPTGGMIPEGADAVVMIEYCELFSETETAVCHSVPAGGNIVHAGDDVQEGEKVLTKGTRLRPQEIGLLAAVGEESVTVVKPWSVTIIATGDELIAPGDRMEPGKVRNINNYGLEAIARQMGFDVSGCFLLKDERGLLEETVRSAMRQSDIVAVSGGSSKGKKDETASVIGGTCQ